MTYLPGFPAVVAIACSQVVEYLVLFVPGESHHPSKHRMVMPSMLLGHEGILGWQYSFANNIMSGSKRKTQKHYEDNGSYLVRTIMCSINGRR